MVTVDQRLRVLVEDEELNDKTASAERGKGRLGRETTWVVQRGSQTTHVVCIFKARFFRELSQSVLPANNGPIIFTFLDSTGDFHVFQQIQKKKIKFTVSFKMIFSNNKLIFRNETFCRVEPLRSIPRLERCNFQKNVLKIKYLLLKINSLMRGQCLTSILNTLDQQLKKYVWVKDKRAMPKRSYFFTRDLFNHGPFVPQMKVSEVS